MALLADRAGWETGFEEAEAERGALLAENERLQTLMSLEAVLAPETIAKLADSGGDA